MKAKAHDDILDKTGKELQEEIIGRVQACQSRLHSERAAVLVSGVGHDQAESLQELAVQLS